MKIGFTGTRQGMTQEQKKSLLELIQRKTINLSQPCKFHHGDCIGADAEAAEIAQGMGNLWIVCHPPIKTEHRAFYEFFEEMRKPKSHFARNRDIVNETNLLIACPKYLEPITAKTMGGTAYTVNYAKKTGKPVYVIFPNGSIEEMK